MLDNPVFCEGIVEEIDSASRSYKVKLDNGGVVAAKLSGKLLIHHVIISLGDRVNVQFEPTDLTQGRIVMRYR